MDLQNTISTLNADVGNRPTLEAIENKFEKLQGYVTVKAF